MMLFSLFLVCILNGFQQLADHVDPFRVGSGGATSLRNVHVAIAEARILASVLNMFLRCDNAGILDVLKKKAES